MREPTQHPADVAAAERIGTERRAAPTFERSGGVANGTIGIVAPFERQSEHVQADGARGAVVAQGGGTGMATIAVEHCRRGGMRQGQLGEALHEVTVGGVTEITGEGTNAFDRGAAEKPGVRKRRPDQHGAGAQIADEIGAVTSLDPAIPFDLGAAADRGELGVYRKQLSRGGEGAGDIEIVGIEPAHDIAARGGKRLVEPLIDACVGTIQNANVRRALHHSERAVDGPTVGDDVFDGRPILSDDARHRLGEHGAAIKRRGQDGEAERHAHRMRGGAGACQASPPSCSTGTRWLRLAALLFGTGTRVLSICICTHNPKPDLFARVLESVAAQSEKRFDVLLIDNASSPPLGESALAPLHGRGIAARILREEKPGLIHARLRAIDATTSDWMLCVDDDNVLAPDYVAEGLAFIDAHPHVAAFGGKLLLPDAIKAPIGARPFLPYLAIRDAGDTPMIGVSATWEIWEPPAAGAFIARAILDDFAAFVRTNAASTALGRAPGSFASCEDSLLMHSAHRLGRATGYNPRLKLDHHIDPKRFENASLLRLMEGYGRSHVLLEQLVRGRVTTPHYYRTPALVAATMAAAMAHHITPSPMFGYARARYHLAAARAYRDIEGARP